MWWGKTKHVETHGTLKDDEHGFRKNRSCMTQLILAIQNLAMRIDLIFLYNTQTSANRRTVDDYT
jgi:hypothetical protein